MAGTMEGGGGTPAPDPRAESFSSRFCYDSEPTPVAGLGRVFDTQRRLTGGQDAAGGESWRPFWHQTCRIRNAVSPGPKAGEEELVCQVCVCAWITPAGVCSDVMGARSHPTS